LQSVVEFIYPPRCLLCNTQVAEHEALCGWCWRETPFIGGTICDACGAPLPGEPLDEPEYCDDCVKMTRPWKRGRAALIYRANARKLILAFKHGSRPELAAPVARWMMAVGRDLLLPGTLVVPVPSHWTRLLRRRYNQSALLADEIARRSGLESCPDALARKRRTRMQEGLSREQRFRNVAEAIVPHGRRGALLKDRNVLLVDDVMTSGATLAAASEACHVAGAREVSVLVLARVAKDT